MAKLGINTGTTPNDGTGDTLLSAALKINQNFNEIYSAIGNGTSITNEIGYSNSSGISSYSLVSGVSTYSGSSGISTVSEGLTGTPSISVGVVTATSYQGDGSNLTGIVTYITAGTNVTISQSNGNVTINASGGGGGGGESYWVSASAGIHTLSNVGIGTTNPTSKLTVNGNVNISGIVTASTFVGNLTGTATTASTVNILNTNGLTTVYYPTFVENRTDGQTVRADVDLTYRTDTNTLTAPIISSTQVNSSRLNVGTGGTVITTTSGGSVGVGTTNPTSALTVVGSGTSTSQLYVSGISTFNKSAYLNASNSEYVGFYLNRPNGGYANWIYNYTYDQFLFQSDASPLIINSKDYIQITSGTGAAEEILAQFNYNGSVDLYHDNSKKFATLGAGVTVTGTTFTNQLSVSGVSTFNNNVRVAGIVTASSVLVSNDGGNNGSLLIEDTGASSQLSFRRSGGSNGSTIQGVEGNLYINPGSGGGYVSLSNPSANLFYDTGDVRLNNGLQGTTIASNGLQIIGLTSTTSFSVGTGGTIINATATGLVGIGTTNPTSALTVKGNTSLETLSVSGVSTFSGSNVKLNSGNSLDFGTGAGDLHIYKQSGGGSDSIIKYDGSYNFKVLSDITTLASSSGSVTWGVFGNNGVELYYGNSKKFETLGTGVTVTGTTFTNQLSVSGVSTFSGIVYESVSNSFSTTLNPSSGTLTIPVNSSILVGTLGSTVTTWNFTGINTSSPRSVTISMVIDSNSLYTYGDSCQVNGLPISGGVRWAGGLSPVATNNEDVLSFTIITDASGEVRVYGSSTLNYS